MLVIDEPPAVVCTQEALTLLRRAGHPVVPHVAARLTGALRGDRAAIVESAALLSQAQRSGLSALPDPLPLVPAIAHDLGPALAPLSERDRFLLLCASVAVDERADVLLAAAEMSLADILDSGAIAHLDLAAGRLRYTDPRVRILVHADATLGERTAVHAALATAYREAGDTSLEAWHTSLSTLDGDPDLAPRLLSLASRARASGAAEWAHAVAREAASHASGADRVRAQITAGQSALDAGLLEDAVAWLRGPVGADDDLAALALPAFVDAVTLLGGSVPDRDVARHVSRLTNDDDPDLDPAGAVAEAVGVAACRHAERGHDADASALLSRAGDLAARRPTHRISRSVARWCAQFDVTAEGVGTAGVAADDDDAVIEQVIEALELARDDQYEHALGVLQAGAGAPLGGDRPWFSDVVDRRSSPLAEAHRRLAIALVEFWAGDLARARSELADAALVCPIGLPLAGFGVALARRLDTCTDGVSSPTSLAWEELHPTPNTRLLRSGLLVDHAVSAYLDGRMTEAATLLSLAGDASSRPCDRALRLPGLDESAAWSVAGRPEEAHRAAERLATNVRGLSPLQSRALLSRARVATATAQTIDERAREAEETCRVLTSPFERARTEMILGRARLALGQTESARGHLLAAVRLFDSAGAVVWRDACASDLGALPEEDSSGGTASPPASNAAGAPVSSREGTVTPPGGESDLDTVCRAAWQGVLTDREQDVALLVAQGMTNREIAAELFVSVRTVEVHLGRVFTKLGVTSRVALAVVAHRLAQNASRIAS